MPSLTWLRTNYSVTPNRAGKIFRIFLFLLLLFVAGFVFFQSSFFEVRKIALFGNQRLQKEQIIKLAGLNTGKNIFKLNLKEARKRIATHPFIKNTAIKRKLPGTIIIEVWERVPVALTSASDGYIQVDKEGFFLLQTLDLTKANLPLITGVEMAKAVPGEKIKNERLSLGLSYVNAMDEALSGTISEINVANPNQILLYTIDGIEIRAGNANNPGKSLETIAAVLARYGKEAIYIDISYKGPPVIKTRIPPPEENPVSPQPASPPSSTPAHQEE